MNNQRPGFQEATGSFEGNRALSRQGLREVQASVAKTHFSQLLDEVERGASFVIMRHNRPVAHLSPDPDHQRLRKQKAIANIKKLGEQIRRETGSVTVKEILSSIHEGHKY